MNISKNTDLLKKISRTAVVATTSFAYTSFCHAENLSDAFGNKLSNVANTTGYNTVSVNKDSMIGDIIQIFLSLLGVIFLVLMLYGGYLWMTDRGSEKSIEKAKNLIQAAIIGLIIVLASYAITYFVVSQFGSATLIQ